jgi:hypothetical protein
LQQARKSEPPAQPHTIIVRWVDKDQDPGVGDGASPGPNPSAEPAPEPELPNEPTAAAKTESNADPVSVQHPKSNIQHPFSPDLPEAS